MGIPNKIQVISYPDSLGKNLQELHYVLRRYFAGAAGGVHILPFYPSSADRGFSPITYYEVDPAFGTWRDIEMIQEDFDVTIDFMVNHISRQSRYFSDYIHQGGKSEYADMFLSFNKLASDGHVSEDDLQKVYTRKPALPYQDNPKYADEGQRLSDHCPVVTTFATTEGEEIVLVPRSPTFE